jgi:7-cyano-7-deazaguanine synthase
VVQGRNLLFAAIACALAEPGDLIWFGVHAGDHPIYRDCRPEFWLGLSKIMQAAYDVSTITPFLGASKADIARTGHALKVPYEMTWSCYVGGAVHCGRCGTCVERAEAFYLAMVPDPTTYADDTFWREVAGL